MKTWHVVSFYAGDLYRLDSRGKDRPRGFVRGTYGGTRGKSAATKEARDLEARLGQHVSARAYEHDHAMRIFELTA